MAETRRRQGHRAPDEVVVGPAFAVPQGAFQGQQPFGDRQRFFAAVHRVGSKDAHGLLTGVDGQLGQALVERDVVLGLFGHHLVGGQGRVAERFGVGPGKVSPAHTLIPAWLSWHVEGGAPGLFSGEEDSGDFGILDDAENFGDGKLEKVRRGKRRPEHGRQTAVIVNRYQVPVPLHEAPARIASVVLPPVSRESAQERGEQVFRPRVLPRRREQRPLRPGHALADQLLKLLVAVVLFRGGDQGGYGFWHGPTSLARSPSS